MVDLCDCFYITDLYCLTSLIDLYDLLQGTAVVQQRRPEDEQPIEVGKLAASDYFGMLGSFILASRSVIVLSI